jgi:uncharacterized protein (TIGR03084 family)
MEAIMTALREQQDELGLLLSGFDDEVWERPSRCPGWTVSDVVLHLAQTDELVVASSEGRFAEVTARFAISSDGRPRSADDAVALMVETERGAPGPEVHSRWRVAAEAERALLGACDPGQRLPWVSGELPARTVATTRLAETWIHTGDVAWALGVDLATADRLWHIARLAWRALPYAFRRSGRALHGPVALELTAPNGTTWSFNGDSDPVTTVRGSAAEFCLVAARRLDPNATGLVAEGPDAADILSLARTYA